MRRCGHVQWLDLDSTKLQWTLTDPGRLKAITSELPKPDEQQPSLVLFVGKRLKSTLLPKLYPSNNVNRRQSHSIANVMLDWSSHTFPHPVLFADCTPGATCISTFEPNSCHESRRYAAAIAAESGASCESMIATIHVNLLFPFCHVVCMFADDLGGNRSCADYIASLTRCRRSTDDIAIGARPNLLVVSAETQDMDALMQLECQNTFNTVFESFFVVTLTDNRSAADCEKLRRTLNHVIDDARQLRHEHSLLLSASALADLFSRAVEIISRNPCQCVDLLRASCHPAHLLVRQHVASHLRHFVQLASDQLRKPTIVDLLASALLVQGYPIATHRMAFPVRR